MTVDMIKERIGSYPLITQLPVGLESNFKGVIDIASEKGIKVISDEVYSHLSFKPFTSVLDIDSTNIIYIQSFSKTYGMTGFRLGYILAERKMIDEVH